MTAPTICGFVLPTALAAAVVSGRWTGGADPSRVRDVFGEAPSPSSAFYSVDEMRGETSRWIGEADPAYLGAPPHDLRPAQSVLIGDLGYDRPFALDYRVAPPAVRLLTIDGRWVQVSGSIEELLARLDMDG